MNNQDEKIVNMLPVRPSKLKNILQRNQTYVWHQDDVYLADHRLIGPFQFGTIGRNKFKCPIIITKKQWTKLYEEEKKKGINTSYTK